jgi:hypothetical protein
VAEVEGVLWAVCAASKIRPNSPFGGELWAVKAIVFLALNKDYHGKSIYVSNGGYTELEGPVQASRPSWLGAQNTAWVDQRKAAKIKLGRQEE